MKSLSATKQTVLSKTKKIQVISLIVTNQFITTVPGKSIWNINFNQFRLVIALRDVCPLQMNYIKINVLFYVVIYTCVDCVSQ